MLLVVIVDTIIIDEHVQRVEQRSIVVHEQLAVRQRMYDIMQIHHVVRRHVQINHYIRTIQAMHQVIIVVGNVILHIISLMRLEMAVFRGML